MTPPDPYALYPHHMALFQKARPFILQAWEDQHLGRDGLDPAFLVQGENIHSTSRSLLRQSADLLGKDRVIAGIDAADPKLFFPVALIADRADGNGKALVVFQMARPIKPVWEA